jgi:two-component system phosphate regulon sensor histidine kinase PhoR
MKLGFRTRLFLAAMAPVLVAALVLDLALDRVAERETLDEASASLDLVQTLAGRDARALEPSNRPEVRRFASDLGLVAGVRVTVVGLDGTVLADSEVGASRVPGMEDHAGRPEIGEALASGEGRATRYSDTVGAPLMYAARKVETREGPVILRLAVPVFRLDRESTRRRLVILATTAAALLFVGAGLFATSSLAARRARRMAVAANRMADGEFGLRLEDPTGDDLARLAGSLNRLSESCRVTFGRLEADGRRVRAILDAMREGVMAVGPDGRIRLVNRAMLELAGHEGDATGLRPGEVLRSPEILGAIEESLAGSQVSREATLTHPRAASLRVSGTPLSPDGGAVVVVHDTTALERVERVRRDFVANVSHELRNPIATVLVAAETLQSLHPDDADEDRRRLHETIARQAERLGTLVRDLLDLARLEGGQVPIRLADSDLGPLLEEACAAFEDRVRANGQTLAVRVEPGASRCRCDPSALSTVLSNLLDNAVKYTRAGDAIEVRTRAAAGRIEIEVADTGPGIAEHHLSRLFERFYRVDAGRSRDLGGTGLGLAIVKHLVQAMDGSVQCRSTPGQGSAFTVSLQACGT